MYENALEGTRPTSIDVDNWQLCSNISQYQFSHRKGNPSRKSTVLMLGLAASGCPRYILWQPIEVAPCVRWLVPGRGLLGTPAELPGMGLSFTGWKPQKI